MPESQLRLKKPAGCSFFIRKRSRPSEKTLLPSNTISLIFVFGPSSMMNDSCWPALPMAFASCRTVAKGRPFSTSISLMIDSTRRAFAGS